ncbi:MAG TPA: cytochrome c3 family protein [Xanthobacteraceae bacterium]|nr:cytochrome c3 family protein [Xanthobacteraceae bacterium]
MVTMMDGCNTLLKILRLPWCNGLVIAAFAAALAIPPTAMRPAFAAGDAPSAADRRCLSCHGGAGMEKNLEDGSTLSLHVPADMFAKSVHRPVGCAGCHSEVDLAAHPPAKKNIASARSFSLTMTQVCRGCHADKFDQWESSIHAALVRSGNAAAPVCTDCHNPHAVIKDAATKIDQIPCKKCHGDIYAAYLESMHAKARLKSEQSYAPICTSCHSAHAVKPTALGQGPQAACFGCHADALEAHQKWLPNAALHFEVVSCPACHAPDAPRKVDLMLIDSRAQPLGTEQVGVPVFEASAQSGDKGIDAPALWKLLQTLNRSGIAGNVVLRGRLEAFPGPQAHRLADKSKAISDCRTCHRAGSQAFQSVTVSLVGPEGRRVEYGANSDVLNSVISVGSVRGFYAIGGTRIKLLDLLVILAILGGIGVGVGHMTLGWIFRRYGLPSWPFGGQGGGQGNQPGGGEGQKTA